MARLRKVQMAPRVSWRFFPSQQGLAPMGHEFMFTRDVPAGIMPLGGTRDNPRYVVRLEPHDDDVAAWLPGFLHIGQFDHDALDEALVEFVDTATHYLVYSGQAYFELIPSLGDTRFRYARLGPLPPGPVRRLPRKYLQMIPTADRAQSEGRRWNAVPSERMWQVRLPRELGSPRAHRRLLKRVRRFGDITPTFVLQTNDLGRSVGYDLKAYHAATSIETERATNRWGTIPSFFQIEGATEYFLFSRRLQWKRAQALVREHLIDELNRLLPRLGITSELAVEGLPSSYELAATIHKLQRGEISVEEAMAVGRT